MNTSKSKMSADYVNNIFKVISNFVVIQQDLIEKFEFFYEEHRTYTNRMKLIKKGLA